MAAGLQYTDADTHCAEDAGVAACSVQAGTWRVPSALGLSIRSELNTNVSPAALTCTLRPAGDNWLLVDEQRADAHQQREDCRGCEDAAGTPHRDLDSRLRDF